MKRRKKKRVGRQGSRTVPLSPELGAYLKGPWLEEFRRKFGRDPRPEDPIVYDPDAHTPQPLSEEKGHRIFEKLCRAMAQAGIDPAKIYAARRTELVPTTETWNQLTQQDRDEFQAALEEYQTLAECKARGGEVAALVKQIVATSVESSRLSWADAEKARKTILSAMELSGLAPITDARDRW